MKLQSLQKRGSIPRSRYLHLILALILGALITHRSAAQDDSVVFVDASPRLRSPTLGGMTQDRYGFLWILGPGLARYDGDTYLRVNGDTSGTSGPIQLHRARGVAGGQHEFVCVYSVANQLLFQNIDNNKRKLISLAGQDDVPWQEINCVMEDSAGRFWVGGAEGDLFRITPDPLVIECLTRGQTASLAPFSSIWGIAESSRGDVWIATEGGLFRIVGGTTADVSSMRCDTLRAFSRTGVVGIKTGKSGRIWLCTRDRQIAWIDPDNLVVHSLPTLPVPEHPETVSLAEDCNGDIWIGAFLQGLFRWHSERNRWERYLSPVPDQPGHVEETIISVLSDRSGVLWVITVSRGLLRTLPGRQMFHSYSSSIASSPRLSGEDIIGICVDQTRTLWVGSQSGGLNFLTPGSPQFGHLVHDPSNPRSLSSNCVITVIGLRNGEIWTGNAPGGINILDRKRMTFSHLNYRAGDSSSLGSDNVTSLYQDSRDIVWVGHFGGIDQCDPSTRKFTPFLR